MKARSPFSPGILGAIQRSALRVARWAGYEAARPSRGRNSHTYTGTDPNSAQAHRDRTQMMWDAEWLVKNIGFAIGYIYRRRAYCSSGIKYQPDTGDAALDKELADYLENTAFPTMGINRSMQEAFMIAADFEQPVRGDSLLIWYRDTNGLRLVNVSADQIGELWAWMPEQIINGYDYNAGVFTERRSGLRRGFRIYDRAWTNTYTNPTDYDEEDCIYFCDMNEVGIRGVTKFAQAIVTLTKRDKLFQVELDAATKNAKLAAVVFNSGGQPEELSYETEPQIDGSVQYVERFADGAVTEYKFTGDSYSVVPSERPGQELIEGLAYCNREASLGLGFPYSFLVTAEDIGGAPSRFEINLAGKEIRRITHCLHAPKLTRISTITILDAVERGIFRPRENITRGTWAFPSLPVADSFNDTRDDIASLESGIATYSEIYGKYGQNAQVELRRKLQERVLIHKLVQDANEELERAGYEPTLTTDDIAKIGSGPAQPSPAQIEREAEQAMEVAKARPVPALNGNGNGNGNRAVNRLSALFESGCGANAPGGGGFQPGNTCSTSGGGDYEDMDVSQIHTLPEGKYTIIAVNKQGRIVKSGSTSHASLIAAKARVLAPNPTYHEVILQDEETLKKYKFQVNRK